MPTFRSIEANDSARKKEAALGSQRLLLAILRYGATHGLPNHSADQCRCKLANMA